MRINGPIMGVESPIMGIEWGHNVGSMCDAVLITYEIVTSL